MSRQMPNSMEAEQALLGAMLVYEKSVRIAIDEGCRHQDFYLEAHRKIYRVMESLAEEGKPCDVTTVASRLQDLSLLESCGGMNYLLQLSDSAVTSTSTKHYVEILQNKAYLRNLIETAQQIAEEGFNEAEDVEIVLYSAEKRILDVTRTRRTSEFRSSAEVVNTVMENIYKMKNQKSRITGIRTGYKDLDDTTNGLQRGDLIILAARPSMGKTAFALNLALNAAQLQTDQAVAVFSLEMPAEQLIQRMMSTKSEVDGMKIRSGFLNNDEMNSLAEAATEMRAMKIYIDDTPGVRVSEIFSKCRKLNAEHGLSLVVIDYIQLITGNGKNSDNRQQEVSEISRSLKALARELKVPVIALSQLSRKVEERTEKIPMLSDLRESGAIEQDADIVMFLYREAYYAKLKDKDESVTNESVDVIIAKHRNGATKNITLSFERNINSFKNPALEYEGV
ncbi:MAG: replicative DNA helicase [Erysipelotrichaceae bacterium]|nr:replicative DNA helicase [Erysipelotrichaceae bacterium]